MALTIWNFLLNALQNLGDFAQWLFEPIAELNGIAPIALFSIGGFAVVMGFHILHLVNFIGG